MRRRSTSFRAGLAATATCLTLLLAGASSAGWYVENIEAHRWFEHTSLRLDPSGRPAIAYAGGENLYYAVWDGASWSTEIVDASGCLVGHQWSQTGRGPGLSLAFDPAGNPTIAYCDSLHEEVRLARWDEGRWLTDSILTGRLESERSLAFDDAGHPALAYHHKGLRFAHWDGSRWNTEDVDDGAATGSSLAFEPGGHPIIVYERFSDLKASRWDGSEWIVEEVTDGDIPEYVQMALDPKGLPAVSYTAVLSRVVKFAHWDSEGWNVQTVTGTGLKYEYTSLAFDQSGNPAIAFRGGSPSSLRLARWNGISWAIEVVDDADPPWSRQSSLAFEPSGDPIISYVGSYSNELKLARQDATRWSFETIDSGTYVGQSPSMAITDTSDVVVSYVDKAYGRLWFARWDGSIWTHELVDDTVPSPEETSLRLDAAGKPAIAYNDVFPDEIKLARRDGSGWTLEVVRAGVDCLAPSLAFDAAGNPLISNSDPTLYLARWDGFTWNLETINQEAAYDTSLALDNAGLPAVAYHGRPEDPLRFARWDGSGWSTETVDTNPGVGNDPSLTFDRLSGYPSISYLDQWKQATKLARWDGTSWQLETVDAAGAFVHPLPGNEGERIIEGPSSLVFDANGLPAISYAGSLELKYAHWDGARWQTEAIEHTAAIGNSLALTPEGQPVVVFYDTCQKQPRIAWTTGPVTLYRGVVASLAAGWRAESLPLDSTNDDETPPFPMASAVPGSAEDMLAGTSPLTLYRVLWPEDKPARNTLRVIEQGSGVALSF